MNKTMKADILFLKKKEQRHRNKLRCKFIRINTRNAENGYDAFYEVSKIQMFSKFKDKK